MEAVVAGTTGKNRNDKKKQATSLFFHWKFLKNSFTINILLYEKPGPCEEETRELAKRESPEVTTKKKIKLLRVDEGQAHFVDSDGNFWYFDSDKREWGEMLPGHIHPMALQFSHPQQPERSEFETIEDAARHALKIHFRSRAELLRSIANDPTSKQREEAEQCALLYEQLVEVIDDIEREGDINKKPDLDKKFLDLLKKLDEEEK